MGSRRYYKTRCGHYDYCLRRLNQRTQVDIINSIDNSRQNPIFLLQVNFSKGMSSEIVKRLLHDYVDSMYCEGYINSKFYELLHFRPGENRNRLVQKVEGYCSEVDTLVSELEGCNSFTNIDLYAVAAKANLIEERSACIGALHVRNACLYINQACEKKHKQSFSQALGWLKNEFASTRKKLETCAQMDRRLIRLEQKKK